LNAVGLSNVVVMSDAQGTQIRAKGKPLIGDPAGVRLFRLPMVTPRIIIQSPSINFAGAAQMDGAIMVMVPITQSPSMPAPPVYIR
jgi:hypothetical protein